MIAKSKAKWIQTPKSNVQISLFAWTALPIAMLFGFWGFGEVGLISVAVGSVVLSVCSSFFVDQHLASGRQGEDRATLSRDALEDWLESSVASNSTRQHGQTAVISAIIDDLDALEARLGREAKKAVKEEVLRRLVLFLRREDVIATLDDNLMAIGLKHVLPPESENLVRLSRRLQGICDEPVQHEETRVYCSLSLGVAAETHLQDATPSRLVSAAIHAGEFAAKTEAGSVRLFSRGLLSEKEEERRRVKTLSNGLETSEIFAWFQPQVSSDGLKLMGFEALARWDTGNGVVVPPGVFLPDIQRAGLSQRLTEVILKQSLTALMAWDAAGYRVPSVSVNFSEEELRNPRLADYVMWELDRFNIAPNRLIVEVLESVIAEHHEAAITRTLMALSERGCQIDLDDFGTGFTSILNIRRFNVSRIKIDRQLIARLDKDADQRRMVSALLSFSQKLGIEALAEGVETGGECKVLHKLGCPLIQGYIAAKPMPLGESFHWLDKFEDGVSIFEDEMASRSA